MWLYVINGYSFDEEVNDVYVVVLYLFVMIMMSNVHDGYDMHKDHGVMIWCILTCVSFIIWCHDISFMFTCWCCNFWGYYDVKHVVIESRFYNMRMWWLKMMLCYHHDMQELACGSFFYDIMIISNAMFACWNIWWSRGSPYLWGRICNTLWGGNILNQCYMREWFLYLV